MQKLPLEDVLLVDVLDIDEEESLEQGLNKTIQRVDYVGSNSTAIFVHLTFADTKSISKYIIEPDQLSINIL